MAVEKRPIGKYLRRFRDTFHLTQKDVAEKIAVHPQLYLKYENDSSAPSANVISSIAVNYNVTSDYLLGLSDEPRPAKYDAEEVREAFKIRDMFQKSLSKIAAEVQVAS